MWRPWKWSNFQDPYTLSPSTSKIFSPPWPWTSNFKRTRPSLTKNIWKKHRTVLVNKQNQNKTKTKLSTSHSNWPRVLLFDLAHKQCNGIIKKWLLCLKPELMRRFFVNNKLMFDSAWDLVVAEIKFSLMKIKKIVRPEQSPPPPPTSDSISLIIKDTPSWRVMKNTPSPEVIYFLVIKIAGHEKS